jgi:glycosyltransferase involved in cell wall biosynthesis
VNATNIDVLFLVKSHEMASSRIRVVEILPFLEQYGIRPVLEVLPDGFLPRWKLFSRTRDFHVTVLQKHLLKLLDFRQLRAKSNVLIYDFDDAVYCRSASPSSRSSDYYSRTRQVIFSRIARQSDRLIAANQVLAGSASTYAPETPVDILPSPVAISDLIPRREFTLGSPPIIGWVGSKATLPYLEMIRPQLAELTGPGGCQLHVVSDEGISEDGLNVRFIPWRKETQYEHIRQFDVGIMPLSSDAFSEGKSSYKLLQYLACGIPAVCSAVGMNIEVAHDEQNCLLATEPEEFVRQIGRLLSDHDLRSTLGLRGPELIRNTYSQEVIARRLAEIIRRSVGHG